MPELPVCVEDNQRIWCVAKPQKPPDPDRVKTLCGFVVILPYAMERRVPTCHLCRMRAKKAKKTVSRKEVNNEKE